MLPSDIHASVRLTYHAFSCERPPRASATAARRLPPIFDYAICSRRDAAQVSLRQAARPPGQRTAARQLLRGVGLHPTLLKFFDTQKFRGAFGPHVDHAPIKRAIRSSARTLMDIKETAIESADEPVRNLHVRWLVGRPA